MPLPVASEHGAIAGGIGQGAEAGDIGGGAPLRVAWSTHRR